MAWGKASRQYRQTRYILVVESRGNVEINDTMMHGYNVDSHVTSIRPYREFSAGEEIL